MAKVRAYKIAEELGIERTEFVEKARAIGVEIKSAMASVDDEEAALLREKLGVKIRQGPVIEARVIRKEGAAVIRRRKRVEPEPEPAPVEPGVPGEVPGEPAEPVLVPEEIPGGIEPVVPGVAQPEPPAEVPPGPRPEVPAPVSARGETGAVVRAKAGQEGARATQEAPDRKGRQRKQFKEVVNLREQEKIARQVTSRTTGRPQVAVDPRAFTSPRRRRSESFASRATSALRNSPGNSAPRQRRCRAS